MIRGNVMCDFATLEDHLGAWSHGNSLRAAAAESIEVLAHACRGLAEVVAGGRLAGDLAAHHAIGISGEAQKELDVRANELLATALLGAPVAAVASKEMEAPLPLTLGAPVVVAIDPLDGSSNIDANVSLGTIFSILPTPSGHAGAEPAAFLRKGREQIAAGYVIYGPQTALALTTGQGTEIFTLDHASNAFRRTGARVRVPRAHPRDGDQCFELPPLGCSGAHLVR
jgi:fructose-1,6-bisphosphatase I